MDHFKNKLKDWAVKHAEGPHSKFWLGFLSFTESSFFPVPPDILLIAILISNKARRWVFYSIYTTIFSVLGGVFGYIIGLLFFQTFGQKILDLYSLQEGFEKVQSLYGDNAFWAVFAAAFTPLPYKIFTLTAGLTKINALSFILGSFFGRGLRFLGEGLFIKIFGEKISGVLYKYFNIFSFLLLLVTVLIVILFLN